MIISRTPFRVSFAGGGTDIKAFYHLGPGGVVSTAIKKYMYITVNRRFDSTIRVSYSKTEIVSKVEEINHPIVREALKLVGIDGGIEIVSIADIPAGTGLGSSSSFTVGLLNALYAFKGVLKNADELARAACQIEIELLGEPIGKQDQYIAAYGGLRHFQFNPDESVFVNPIICDEEIKKALEQSLLLVYMGSPRSASSILNEQRDNTGKEREFSSLKEIRNLGLRLCDCLTNGFTVERFGSILHNGWLLKRGLVGSISNCTIDGYYDLALDAGAIGGKLLGAGGGGFLLLVCTPDKRPAVRQALASLPEMGFSLESEGSKIVYVL
jgi:D-glycero-alpha-D-manno-heptose-7-phosphate kinase